ncbi:hypothetical protein EDI_231850, partial [Entamoeba dispar SAW760]
IFVKKKRTKKDNQNKMGENTIDQFIDYFDYIDEGLSKRLKSIMKMMSKTYLVYGHMRWYDDTNMLGIDIIEKNTGRSVCLIITDLKKILVGRDNKIISVDSIEKEVKEKFKHITEELIEELKIVESGGPLEGFTEVCMKQKINPNHFIEYKERCFEKKFKGKLESIRDNSMTKDKVYKWLEKKKRNNQENIKKVKDVVIRGNEEEIIDKPTIKEKKTPKIETGKIRYNLIHNIKGTILAEDEECENSWRIKKLAQVCNRQLIPKETAIYFIQQELNIIHESVDIAITLFGKKIINIEELENNLMNNFCLNDRNIKKLLEFQLDKDTDQLFFDRWFRKKLISKETYLAAIQKMN